MFEFHGWVSLHVPDEDDADLATLEECLETAEAALGREIRKAADGMSIIEIRHAGNGLRCLVAHGLRNHRYEPLLELFRRTAGMLPDSYGLLYVRDDEDDRGAGGDFTNAFRAWRVARGRLEELDDQFLSPCVPVIERPGE